MARNIAGENEEIFLETMHYEKWKCKLKMTKPTQELS